MYGAENFDFFECGGKLSSHRLMDFMILKTEKINELSTNIETVRLSP
jgi:hypothetical protein